MTALSTNGTQLVTQPSQAAPMTAADMVQLTLAQVYAQRLSTGGQIVDYMRANAAQQKFQLEAGMLNQMIPGLNLNPIPFGSTVNVVNTGGLSADPATQPIASQPTQPAPVQPAPVVPAAPAPAAPAPAATSTSSPVKTALLGAAAALGIGGVGVGGYLLSGLTNKPATPPAPASPAPAQAPVQIPLDLNWNLSDGTVSGQQQSTTVTSP